MVLWRVKRDLFTGFVLIVSSLLSAKNPPIYQFYMSVLEMWIAGTSYYGFGWFKWTIMVHNLLTATYSKCPRFYSQ
jgi:hypothetical protein